MISGRAGLSSFDAALAEAGRTTDSLTAEVTQINDRLMAIRGETAEAYKALALLRLADAGGAAARLDAAAGAVQQLVAARADAMADAEAALATGREAWTTARQARDDTRGRLDALEAQEGKALDAARKNLPDDPAFRALKDAAEAAARIAVRAEQKTALATTDRTQKGQPFEADPLFLYLWQRGYGTPRYSAGPFTKMMDGFVARIARYEPARRNYAMLTDLPAKLADHAEQVRSDAAAADARVKAYEREAATRGGGPASAAVDAARAAFDQADAVATKAEASLREVQQKVAAMAAGQDAEGQAAAGAIEEALKREDLTSLREAAARTPSPDDDALVMRIERLEQERWRLSQELESRRELLQAAQARAAQAGQMRQEYQARGYGGGQLDTASSAMIGALLGQVLGGAMSSGGFFDRIERSRRADPWGRRAPGPWGGGSGGSSGGGFTTGGGMGGGGGGGGGGFKTGGGF